MNLAIEFKDVTHIYSDGTPFRYAGLSGVDLKIEGGRITALIGATGSGKSTLVQHLNALLLPTSGTIDISGNIIRSDKKPEKLKALRKNVGLVFQFPEYQLFEETILKDVMFGPINFKMENPEQMAIRALKMVGLDESFYNRSPLELSGGQKRRVAIAGILAIDPEILVLDEPTAGLDPSGTRQMMDLFKMLNKEYKKTIIIVTHDMEQVLTHCDDVVVMDKGRVKIKKEVKDFFRNGSLCESVGILPPMIIRFRDELIKKGYKIDDDIFDVDSLARALAGQVKDE